jgi:sugar lactone lactonase YvrE
LLFVDIMRGHVHAFSPGSGADRVYEVGQPVGAVACAERGDWILAAGRGFSRLDPDTGLVTPLAAVTDRADVRMNDGYVDSRGRFWAGTMSLTHAPDRGVLYRLDPDGSVHAMLEPVTTSNGIDWSVDGRRMYYVDTRTERIDMFDFDEVSGTISERRPFVTFPGRAGRPDGLVVEAADGVWVGLWGGRALERYTPTGELDHRVAFPVSLVTKCAFGGSQLADLFVTTAWIGLSDDDRPREPLAGALFHLTPGVKGRPPRRFGG